MFPMRAASSRCAVFLAISALGADTGVRVRSSPFASSVLRISWAGPSSYSCDEGCKGRCFTAGTVDDFVIQRLDACVAGCGCGGGMDHVFSTTEVGTALYSKDGGDSWVDLQHQVSPLPKDGTRYHFTMVHVSHADPRYVALLTNTSLAWLSIDTGSTWRALQLFEPLVAVAPVPNATATAQGKAPQRTATPAAGGPASGAVAAALAKTATWTGLAPHGPEHQILGWKWHPFQKGMALAEAQIGNAPGRAVFVTEDAGASWKLVSDRVHQYHWAAVPGGDVRRLILTRFLDTGSTPAASVRLDGFRSHPQEVLVSEDFMASHTVLLGRDAAGGPPFAHRVHLHYNFIFAVVSAASSLGVPGAAPLSDNGLELWVFSEAGNNSIGAPQPQAQAGQKEVPRQQAQRESYFRLVEWPVNMAALRAHQLRGLRVVYSAEHLVLFFMPAMDSTLPWGHVFSFGYQATEAEPVLTHVQRPPDGFGEISWHAVSGVDGVFIANRVVVDQGQDLDRVDRSFDAQDVLVEDLEEADEDEDEDGAGVEAAAREKMRFVVRTYISLNMGLSWQPLRAPAKDVGGLPLPGCGGKAAPPPKAIATGAAANASVAVPGEPRTLPGFPATPAQQAAAGPPCPLRLDRLTSSSAAPGVIVGVGSGGARLASSSIGVFVSRDGGLSWEHVLRGNHEVSIVSRGDTMVAVPTDSPGTVHYSTNGGRAWQDVVIRPASGNGLALDGLFTHPAHTDGRALVTLRADAASPDVAVAAVDFGPALKNFCQGSEDPASPMSDFEKWSPSDSLEDAHTSSRPVCLQGVRTHYVRRKAERQCKTGLHQVSPLAMRMDLPCHCTIADWACAAGYLRMSYTANAICEPLEGTRAPNVTKMCDTTMDATVQVSRGYVKIPGNGCEGGTDLAPVVEQCPGNVGIAGVLKKTMAWRTSLYLAGAVVAVLLLFLAQRRRADFSSQGKLKKRMYGSANAGDFDGDDDDIERELLISEKDD